MALYWLLGEFVKGPRCVVTTECNKCGWVKSLCMTPVGEISRPVALGDQSVVFDVYVKSVV